MQGTNCGLELSKRVITSHRNPEETEEAMASGLSEVACSSSVLMEQMRTEFGPYSKSSTLWSNNE